MSAILMLGTIIYQVNAYTEYNGDVGEPVIVVDGDAEGVYDGDTYLTEDVKDSEGITPDYSIEDDYVDGIIIGGFEEADGEDGYMGFAPFVTIPPSTAVNLINYSTIPPDHGYFGVQIHVPTLPKEPNQLAISIDGMIPEGWLLDHWVVIYQLVGELDSRTFTYITPIPEDGVLMHTLPEDIVLTSNPNPDAWLMLPAFRLYLTRMTPPTLVKDVIYINDEAFDGQEVSEGDIITYRLRVNNPNPRAWSNFLLVDELPAGLSLIGVEQVIPATALVDNQSSGNTVSVVLNLPPGDVDVIFTARVDDVTLAVDGYFVNVATLYGPPPEEGGERPPVDDCDAEVPARPAGVSLEKSVSSPTAEPGDTLTYRLVVRNTGGAVLTNVVVIDDLPVQLTQPRNLVITPENAGTGNFVGQLLTVNIPRLELDGEVIITFDVTVAANVADGSTIDNVAEVTTDQNVSDRDDESVTVDVPPQYRPPGISLEKSVSAGTVQAGGNLTYTIVVRNLGDIELTNVVVRDNLPTQLTNPRNLAITPAGAGTGSFVGQALTVTIPVLGIDQAVTITFDVTVAAGVANNTVIRNVASVTTDEGPSAQDDARTTVSTRQPGQAPLTGDYEILGSILFLFIVATTILVMMSLIKAEKRKIRKK